MKSKGIKMIGLHLDETVLDSLKTVMGYDFSTLLERFVEDAMMRLEQLRMTAAVADYPGLKSIAHSFKGSCGSIGAFILADLCQQLESAAQLCQTENVSELIGRLEHELGIVISLLHSQGY